VQGEPEPYQVSLSDPFSDEQWGCDETMSQRAIFAAKLLAGEMPQNIEEVHGKWSVAISLYTG